MCINVANCYLANKNIGTYKVNQISDNKYSFSDDICNTVITINNGNFEIRRENAEFILIVFSNLKKATYKTKDDKINVDISILKQFMATSDSNIEIRYQLESMEEEAKIIMGRKI